MSVRIQNLPFQITWNNCTCAKNIKGTILFSIESLSVIIFLRFMTFANLFNNLQGKACSTKYVMNIIMPNKVTDIRRVMVFLKKLEPSS